MHMETIGGSPRKYCEIIDVVRILAMPLDSCSWQSTTTRCLLAAVLPACWRGSSSCTYKTSVHTICSTTRPSLNEEERYHRLLQQKDAEMKALKVKHAEGQRTLIESIMLI